MSFELSQIKLQRKTVETFFPVDNGSTQLLAGEAVFNLLEDTGFLNGWNHLYNTCSWATVFQSPSFVATWYRIYGTAFLPIVIKREYAGKLTGLVTLAMDNKGLITGAGANQAEYQVWLTADANDETFITGALLEIRRTFPGKKVLLKYIPAAVSSGFTKKDIIWKKRCFVRIALQPVMIINDAHLTNELKKKNRKEKINRLKRLGALSFERITDYTTFAAVFDDLALQSDFRKGAMYNKVVFKTDPLRKQFLLALFDQNMLHATVLKLNDTIIASNVSIRSNNQLHLQGINSFAAAYARYSPGIIHFLLLGKLLAEEGVRVFDLTPGADAYKDTLATDYTEAFTLSIGNNYHNVTNRFKFALTSYVNKTAAKAGLQPGTLKKWKRIIHFYKVKCMHVGALLRRKREQNRIVQKKGTGTMAALLNIQKDNLKDLLDFDQGDIRYSQQEFLADAMQRFEEGANCYSWAEDGVLLGCAWSTESSLSGLYCHPQGRQRYPDFIRSVEVMLKEGCA